MATKKHACRWRSAAERLEAELAEQKASHASELTAVIERLNALEHKLALSTKQIIGPKSERMPTPEEEAKRRDGEKRPRGGYTNAKKRKENAPGARVPADHDRPAPRRRRRPSVLALW